MDTRVRFSTLPLARYLFVYAAKIISNSSISFKDKILSEMSFPNLSFLFVESITDSDMRMPIIEDNSELILFSKSVSQKSKEYDIKRAFYCIAKKYISYIILQNNKVINKIMGNEYGGIMDRRRTSLKQVFR